MLVILTVVLCLLCGVTWLVGKELIEGVNRIIGKLNEPSIKEIEKKIPPTNEEVKSPVSNVSVKSSNNIDTKNLSKEYMLLFHKRTGEFAGVRAVGHSDCSSEHYDLKWPNGDET